MIKLFSLKQQSKDGSTTQSCRKTSAAYLRIQKGKLTMYNESSVYFQFSPIDAADLPSAVFYTRCMRCVMVQSVSSPWGARFCVDGVHECMYMCMYVKSEYNHTVVCEFKGQ